MTNFCHKGFCETGLWTEMAFLKVNGDTFREVILPCSFLIPSQLKSTLTEKNLLPKEQILSFKSRLHSGKSMLSREANSKSHMFFPFVKMAEKHGGPPKHLTADL